MLSELQRELQRTDYTLRRLGLLIAERHRKDFAPTFINALLSEPAAHTLSPEDTAKLLTVLRDIPSAAPKPNTGQPSRRMANRLTITNAMREKLKSEMERTNVSLTAMCRYLFSKEDQKRVYHTLYGLLEDKRNTAEKGVWHAVMSYLATMDTAKPSQSNKLHQRIKLSSAEIEKAFPDADEKQILPDLVRGSIKAAPDRPRMKRYVLQNRYRNNGYILIDDDIYNAFHAERLRTCVSFNRLLKKSDDVPAGLNVHQVKQWYYGTVLAAEKRYIDWLLDAYRTLPDYPSSN